MSFVVYRGRSKRRIISVMEHDGEFMAQSSNGYYLDLRVLGIGYFVCTLGMCVRSVPLISPLTL